MTTNVYKYQLRRGGRKMVCPNCGQRRFVPYVLTEDNETIINSDWGRCDRESSCGYWVKPNGNVQLPEAKLVAPAEPLRFRSLVHSIGDKNESNSLWKYAAWLVGKENAAKAFRRYMVTTAYGDWCVFWQIAVDGSIRAAKAIRFVNGHRDKTATPPVRWLHRERAMKKFITGEALEQCFFGEHLLSGGCPVAVVESEKTALLMSAIRPEFVWLAAGGSCNLSNPTKNHVLDGHDVTVFPDNGMFVRWRQIALPKGWVVDDTCLPTRDGFKDGYDILDLYERWAINEETKQERIFL